MISEATPTSYTGDLPAAADVVVIGGGIIGLMTAWELARRGERVVLCEKGRIGGEQSSRNWGWVRQQGRDPAELPIMVEARRLWREMQVSLGEELGYRETGILYLAKTEKDEAAHAAWLEHGLAHGTGTRMLNGDELAAMLPQADKWRSAMWTENDGRAEPSLAMPAFARAAAQDGVILRENCAVRALDIAAGRVAGVVTEHGRIRADRVVLAGGAWSGLFARAQGIHLPLLTVKASVAATVPMPETFMGGGVDSQFSFRRNHMGGYTIAPNAHHDFWIGPDAFRHFRAYLPQLRRELGSTVFHSSAPSGYPDAWRTARNWPADGPSPFEAMRVLNPPANMKLLARVQRRFGEAFPSLGRPVLAKTWAGVIDTLPDGVPVLDTVAQIPGLTLGVGHCGHGFGIAPAYGRILADLASGKAPAHDLTRFRLPRFTDGSKLIIA